ncbi:hypothetical protein B0H16DRAFT_1900598 [Mycena metata]|uniref:Uncharacterized protein n=1 Tax=Mycena metata TaxID=1033252 RepID=A0AAD7MD33_9AGAR|nr:hypothetical protein B0H16DRAFT_1900598 [Mycena metata]
MDLQIRFVCRLDDAGAISQLRKARHSLIGALRYHCDTNCLPSLHRRCILLCSRTHSASPKRRSPRPASARDRLWAQPTISALVVLIDIFWFVPTYVYICAMARVARAHEGERW